MNRERWDERQRAKKAREAAAKQKERPSKAWTVDTHFPKYEMAADRVDLLIGEHNYVPNGTLDPVDTAVGEVKIRKYDRGFKVLRRSFS